MKLTGNIFSLIESLDEANQYSFTIRLNADSDIYRGHFPGNPITPGVVMIAISRELMEEKLGITLMLKAVQSIKYTSVLSPIKNNVVEYNICCQSDGDSIKAKVSVNSGNEIFARMSITWNIA